MRLRLIIETVSFNYSRYSLLVSGTLRKFIIEGKTKTVTMSRSQPFINVKFHDTSDERLTALISMIKGQRQLTVEIKKMPI